MTKPSTSFAIRENQTNDAGTKVWSSRWFAGILGCGDCRYFEGVVEKAKMACFKSGHRIEDHFVDVTEMVKIGVLGSFGVGPSQYIEINQVVLKKSLRIKP